MRINIQRDGFCQASETKPGFNTQTNLFYLAFTTVASFVATFFLGDKMFWVLPRAAAKVADNLGVKAPTNTQIDAVALFQGVIVYIGLNILISEVLFAFDTVSSVFGEALTSGLLAAPKTKEWTELLALLLSEKDGKLILGGLFAKWGFFVPALCSVILPFFLAGVIRTDAENEYERTQGPLKSVAPAAPAAKPVTPAAQAPKPVTPAAQAPKPVPPAAQAPKPVPPADNPAVIAAESAAETAQSAAKAAQTDNFFGTSGFM